MKDGIRKDKEPVEGCGVQGNVSEHIRVRGGLGELYSQQEVLRAGGVLRWGHLQTRCICIFFP